MLDVHWWLTLLAFALGLVLTFALMIRRVTREVPLGAPATKTAQGTAEAGGAESQEDPAAQDSAPQEDQGTQQDS